MSGLLHRAQVKFFSGLKSFFLSYGNNYYKWLKSQPKYKISPGCPWRINNRSYLEGRLCLISPFEDELPKTQREEE